MFKQRAQRRSELAVNFEGLSLMNVMFLALNQNGFEVGSLPVGSSVLPRSLQLAFSQSFSEHEMRWRSASCRLMLAAPSPEQKQSTPCQSALE